MNRIMAAVFSLATFALLTAMPAGAKHRNIVHSVVRAPIVSDGDVAGARFDVVVNFNVSMDPAVNGLSLPAGSQIRIKLPHAFKYTEPDDFPIANVGSLNCVPGNLQCTTAVLVRGWPQHPISPAKYAISLRGNTIVIDITTDIDAASEMDAPGVKGVHLIWSGFRNPDRAGTYHLPVAIKRPGRRAKHGVANLKIRPQIRPSINITSVYAENLDDPMPTDPPSPPPNPNPIYQTAETNSMAPLPWDFLLWDRQGNALVDVELVEAAPNFHLLVQNDRVVGYVATTGPDLTNVDVIPTVTSFEVGATPILGATPNLGPTPTGRLRLWFQTGETQGRFKTTLKLLGSNHVRMVVDVE